MPSKRLGDLVNRIKSGPPVREHPAIKKTRRLTEEERAKQAARVAKYQPTAGTRKK